jgi:DNA repair protein RecO (recombination protein O)
VTQAEILAPHRSIRDDLSLFAAAETMVEAVDKVAEEHERNTPLVVLLLNGLRALDARPQDPTAVAESFLLKLLSLSGFHPALTACAVCGSADVRLWSADLGGAVCAGCAEAGAGAVSPEALTLLAQLAGTDLSVVGGMERPDPRVATEARAMLVGFTEYHLERRMKSVPMLVRTAR